MSKYYIAYGSNLNIEMMKHRCPDAIPMGTAVLDDWRLVFRYHATIEPDKNHVVPVGVWKISKDDEKKLDMYEGFPSYYSKQKIKVNMTPIGGGEPRQITAMVYIMNVEDGRVIMPPEKAYQRVIYEGYQDFGLDPALLNYAVYDAVYVYCKNNGMD